MACFARNSVGMIDRIDLRKSPGLGRARRVAPSAEHCGIRLYWCYRRRIIGVFCERSVACFAIHMRVLAFALHIENIAVARLAGFVSGVLYRAGCNLTDRIAAIVPVLPKATRNHIMPDYQKNDEGENEESRESE